MITTTKLVRVVASYAVLCIATPMFAQDRPIATEDHERPVGGNKMETKCPVMKVTRPAEARHTAAGAMSNRDWWPNQLNLKILHQNSLKGKSNGRELQLRRGIPKA